jgi:activator of HSP90 ATPase
LLYVQVSSMEQEVADKLALLQQLQAQQQALLHKQAALQNSLGAQAALSAQLEALRVSVGPSHAAQQPLCGAAAAAAALHGDSAQLQAAAKAGDQQQRRQQQLLEASAVLQRYKQYILAAAARLSADSSASPTGTAAGNAFAGRDRAAAGPLADVHHQHHYHQQQQQQRRQQQQQQDGAVVDADSFPCFPFNLVDALSLWKISQSAGVPDTAADAAGSSSAESGSSAAPPAGAGADAGSESDVSMQAGMVNLETLEHDVVPMSKWVHVAQQLDVQPQQRQQLKAAWQLFTAAVDKLNMQRKQLVKQLQRKLEDNSTTAAADGAQAADSEQQYAATLAGPAARIRPSAQVSSSSSSSNAAGCACSPLSGSDLQGYPDLADAVEWNLVRGRAMVMLFGWAMMCVLRRRQVGALCVASWPHFPLVRAVAGVLVAGADQQQQQQQH